MKAKLKINKTKNELKAMICQHLFLYFSPFINDVKEKLPYSYSCS